VPLEKICFTVQRITFSLKPCPITSTLNRLQKRPRHCNKSNFVVLRTGYTSLRVIYSYNHQLVINYYQVISHYVLCTVYHFIEIIRRSVSDNFASFALYILLFLGTVFYSLLIYIYIVLTVYQYCYSIESILFCAIYVRVNSFFARTVNTVSECIF
jgi:hypothetical protein